MAAWAEELGDAASNKIAVSLEQVEDASLLQRDGVPAAALSQTA
jgi:hypothetical protein